MIPDSVGSGKFVSEWMDDYVGNVDIHHSDSVYYDAAIGADREPISDGEGGYYVVTRHDQLDEPATIKNTVVRVLSIMWVTGITVLALYIQLSAFGVCDVRSAKRSFSGRTSICHSKWTIRTWNTL